MAERGGYDDVAFEYYDSRKHPTTANFRQASALLLTSWLRDIPPDGGPIVEVGAGDSLLAELLAALGRSLRDVTLTDASEVMLAYSRKWLAHGVRLKIADAASLPAPSGSVALLVAVLGDPYNTPAFWLEAARVLTPEGICLYTTPSYEWSRRFRAAANEPEASAQFEVGTRSVLVPSFIYPTAEQTEMIGRSGLRVAEIDSVSLDALQEQTVSHKLLDADGGGEVLTGYKVVVAERPEALR